MQDQTIELDGTKYHTDRQTVELLEVAQKYDARQTETQSIGERRMQDIAFEHAYESGRIQDGPAPAVTPEQRPTELMKDPESRLAVAEDLADQQEAVYRSQQYEREL
jgi:hypothetical protein